tara:strand:+ start:1275 stop:2618 length:1344 start_codon:yes stop_codon:yes gene_type:complete
MSEIKVNKVSSRTGNAVTLGTSGDTFTIPAGVTLTNSGTATGFGSDSDISWQSIVTSNTTMVAGRGYFIDSSGGAITMTLPASPSVGDTVAVNALDGQTNAVTIARNSSKIEAGTNDLSLTTNYAAVTLVFSDADNGWVRHNNEAPDTFIDATGGTETTSGDFKIHTFNSSSNFVVNSISSTGANNEVSYVVVAAGGSGGGRYGGGGGGGGFREGKSSVDSYTSSPLNAPSGLTITAQTYPITVGAGAAGVPAVPGSDDGNRGGNSIFSTITSTGGGAGAGQAAASPLQPGGSGGGGSYASSAPVAAGGTGNTPPVSPPQGSNGGAGHPSCSPYSAGGGGGATEAGANATSSPSASGRGGAGATSNISGSPVGYSGGGGGHGESSHGVTAGAASPCGSGTAGASSNTNSGNGAANRGGGSGAAFYPGPSSSSGSGGSGVVIIRYKYQ